MKVNITEKQLQYIISQRTKSGELGEQDSATPVNPEPEAGTSDAQSGGDGYPEVGKWESGVTRGAGNQIGITKWSDTVGSTLVRGKGNPLKEQMGGPWTPNMENFNINDFAKSIKWDSWGQWALMGGSILVATLVPGAQGLWISIGLDLLASIDLYFNKKDGVGAGIAGMLSFLPIIGNYAKAGKITIKTAERLAKIMAPLKTEKEVLSVISKLPKQDRYIIQQILKQDPSTLSKMITSITSKQIATKEEALKIALQINNLLKSGKLPKASAGAFYKTLLMKRFGFDIGVSGLIIGGGIGGSMVYNKSKEESDLTNLMKSSIPSFDNIDVYKRLKIKPPQRVKIEW